MKAVVYILLIFTLIACNSGNYDENSFKTSEAAVEEAEVLAEESDMMTTVNYDLIATEKLKELTELQQLITSQPEFDAIRLEQISRMTTDSLNLGTDLTEATLSEIKTLNSGQTKDGHIYKQYQLLFTTQTKNTYDTIYAVFKESARTVDNQQLLIIDTQLTKSQDSIQ